MSDKDPQLLKAAPFTPQNEAVIPATVQKRLPNGALIGLAVGIIALAAVVFILPNWVDAKKPATDNVTPNTAQGANGAAMQSASKENVPGRSPFAEAQETILGKLLASHSSKSLFIHPLRPNQHLIG